MRKYSYSLAQHFIYNLVKVTRFFLLHVSTQYKSHPQVVSNLKVNYKYNSTTAETQATRCTAAPTTPTKTGLRQNLRDNFEKKNLHNEKTK